MASCAVLCFVVLQLLHRGAAVVIQTQQTVLAAVGEDAPLSCQLLVTKDVQQVTWQKVLEKTERNMGSYSEYYGVTVNPGFDDKVPFTEAGLQKNSIVIRNVTDQDEGCYLCLFNTYPDGALRGTTCLKVYELHGPVLDVRNSPPESVVSCSATGRPAPTVTLTVPQQNLTFSQYNSSRETNTNGTVTVTTTALLSASSSTQVGCSVSVNSAAPRELLVTVPGLTETSGDDGEELPETHIYSITQIIVALSAVACVSVALIFLCLKQKKRARDYERNNTPLKTNQDTYEVKTPITREENEIRQRSTDKKSQENSISSPSSVVKQLFK